MKVLCGRKSTSCVKKSPKNIPSMQPRYSSNSLNVTTIVGMQLHQPLLGKAIFTT